MDIILRKGSHRNTLTCIRTDGTVTRINLGPNIPHHDLAHYVVEKQLNLKQGFYGKIKSGMTIEQLSDKTIIKTLDGETWLSEIMTRHLQSLGANTIKVEEFVTLIHWETQTNKHTEAYKVDLNTAKVIKHEFETLCDTWDLLLDNETLELKF